MQENPTLSNKLIPLSTTLGNPEWMKQNADKIRKILPETWTHIRNINLLQVGFQLKVIGVDWRSEEELAKCMAFFERSGLMIRQGMTVRVKR